MMVTKAIGLAMCVGVIAVAFGCIKQEAEQKLSPEEIAHQRLSALGAELMALKTNGQNEVVLERLKAEVTNSVMVPVRGMVFSWWLSEMAAQGLTNDIKAAYLDTIGRDDELTRAGYGMLEGLYQQGRDWAGMLAWTRELLQRGLPADLTPRAWLQIVAAYRSLGTLESFVADIPTLVAAVPPAEAERVADEAFRSAIKAKLYPVAEKIVDAVESAGTGKAELERFARLSRLDVFLAADRLADAEARMWKDAAIADGDLAPRASRLMLAWRKTAQTDSETAFARRVLKEWTSRPMTRDTVADAWVRAAVADKDLNGFMDRVDACLDGGVGTGRLLSAFDSGFYGAMSGGTEEQKRRCCGQAARMQTVPGLREYETTRLLLMRLDGAFYLNDFRAALDLVKAGIPGQDADWHAVLTNKIAAHIALAEQRPEDAIRCFRAHMQRVEAWEQPEMNPENGLLMHKEAVLGYNERRIGDIYAGMGRGQDAAASYRKARDYYLQAMKKVDKESKEYRAYEAEMAAVPSGN